MTDSLQWPCDLVMGLPQLAQLVLFAVQEA